MYEIVSQFLDSFLNIVETLPIFASVVDAIKFKISKYFSQGDVAQQVQRVVYQSEAWFAPRLPHSARLRILGQAIETLVVCECQTRLGKEKKHLCDYV